MDLKQLRSIGGVLTGQPVSRELEWTRLDDNGNEVTSTFTVGVVKLGVAAGERIFQLPEGKSRSATFIHEAIRLGENLTDRIPYEDAANLEPSLFAALAKVADSVNPKAKTDAADDTGEQAASGNA